MPFVREYLPSFEAVGNVAHLAGRGMFEQREDQFNAQNERFYAQLAEQARQADARQGLGYASLGLRDRLSQQAQQNANARLMAQLGQRQNELGFRANQADLNRGFQATMLDAQQAAIGERQEAGFENQQDMAELLHGQSLERMEKGQEFGQEDAKTKFKHTTELLKQQTQATLGLRGDERKFAMDSAVEMAGNSLTGLEEYYETLGQQINDPQGKAALDLVRNHLAKVQKNLNDYGTRVVDPKALGALLESHEKFAERQGLDRYVQPSREELIRRVAQETLVSPETAEKMLDSGQYQRITRDGASRLEAMDLPPAEQAKIDMESKALDHELKLKELELTKRAEIAKTLASNLAGFATGEDGTISDDAFDSLLGRIDRVLAGGAAGGTTSEAGGGPGEGSAAGGAGFAPPTVGDPQAAQGAAAQDIFREGAVIGDPLLSPRDLAETLIGEPDPEPQPVKTMEQAAESPEGEISQTIHGTLFVRLGDKIITGTKQELQQAVNEYMEQATLEAARQHRYTVGGAVPIGY